MQPITELEMFSFQHFPPHFRKLLDTCLDFIDVIFGQLADCANKKNPRAGSFCQRAKYSRRECKTNNAMCLSKYTSAVKYLNIHIRM